MSSQRAPRITINCAECNKEVIKRISQSKGLRYCSIECKNKNQSLKVKFCKCCKEIKTREEFGLHTRSKTKEKQIRNICKNCSAKGLFIKTPEAYMRRLLNGIRGDKSRGECLVTLEDLINLYYKQNKLCALSGKEMTHEVGKGKIFSNISVDRIDSNKGYSLDNIQLLCVGINGMKSDLEINKFRQVCKEITEYKKEQNETVLN